MEKEVKIRFDEQDLTFKSKQEAFDYFVDMFRKCEPESKQACKALYMLNKILGNEEKEDKDES